jgi:hypothetical protein
MHKESLSPPVHITDSQVWGIINLAVWYGSNVVSRPDGARERAPVYVGELIDKDGPGLL